MPQEYDRARMKGLSERSYGVIKCNKGQFLLNKPEVLMRLVPLNISLSMSLRLLSGLMVLRTVKLFLISVLGSAYTPCTLR